MQPGGPERQGPHESVAGTVVNEIVEETAEELLPEGRADGWRG
jgi:hypothetical protein